MVAASRVLSVARGRRGVVPRTRARARKRVVVARGPSRAAHGGAEKVDPTSEGGDQRGREGEGERGRGRGLRRRGGGGGRRRRGRGGRGPRARSRGGCRYFRRQAGLVQHRNRGSASRGGGEVRAQLPADSVQPLRRGAAGTPRRVERDRGVLRASHGRDVPRRIFPHGAEEARQGDLGRGERPGRAHGGRRHEIRAPVHVHGPLLSHGSRSRRPREGPGLQSRETGHRGRRTRRCKSARTNSSPR